MRGYCACLFLEMKGTSAEFDCMNPTLLKHSLASSQSWHVLRCIVMYVI